LIAPPRSDALIRPGTYRLREPAGFCYWARLKGFSGELDDVIANDIGEGSSVVARSSDEGFQASGCGNWTLRG